MRPRNQTARDQLLPVLARRSAISAADWAAQVGVSVATLHRLLQDKASGVSASVLTNGKAGRTRYALRRALRGDFGALPLYQVDAAGQADVFGELALIRPQGTSLDLAGTPWPVPDAARDGWWGGLPYPLNDMRPQGYLGRQLARAQHVALGVAINPNEWSDDDALHVLSRCGVDVSGNLILGDAAFAQWQAGKLEPAAPIKPRALGSAYSRLAEQALQTGVPGSSAAGEFPKFPALREHTGSATPHVLVKFSGADGSPAVQRWADLLVCEHLALETAAALPGVTVAKSRIVVFGGRTFLEAERFDRHGPFGRSPLVCLATLDAHWLGAGSSDWTELAARLHGQGLLDDAGLLAIQHLWWFGRLIANTDMHTGNLSFRPVRAPGPPSPAPLLALAPAYDMLPMLYAPLPGGELPSRVFEPPLPLPAQRAVWAAAAQSATAFWSRAANDTRISAAFRRVCGGHAQRLLHAAQRVA